MLIFDAHLDLSMNAMEWNRDLCRSLTEIRDRDRHYDDKPDRGHGVISFPEMRRGGVGICVATMIARYVRPDNERPGWHSPEQAWAQTQGQLAWYRAMEQRGELAPIRNAKELQQQTAAWKSHLTRPDSAADPAADPLPIGYVLSLEGADSVLSWKHLERMYDDGLRAVGPAHYGPGTYAHGTNSEGGLGQKGRELLREMKQLGIVLDVTHLADQSFWEALNVFDGPLWASHNNCRTLVPHPRQYSDDQLQALIERGAVIGGVLDAWMLVPDWFRGKTTPQSAGLKLEHLIDHFDHICQLAGNARHVGIGSDLDGGFGTEQTPQDLDSIADLARLPSLLQARGYSQRDIQGVMHGNFLRFLQTAWT